MERETNRAFWISLAIVYALAIALNEVEFTGPPEGGNPQIDEARAWWSGRLDLPERQWDTAYVDGKVFSHFPPMFTFIAALVVPFYDGVPRLCIALLAATVPFLGLILFRRVTNSAWTAAALTIALVFGTSAWPVLERAVRTVGPYYVNQLLALVGTLLFLAEYFGRRRIAIMGLGVLIAAHSRQMTIALAIPFLYAALANQERPRAARRFVAVAAVGLLIAAVPLTLNAIKFGHPLKPGYMLIYAADADNPERTDSIAMDAKTYGIFSTAYLKRNLYYTNVGLPERREVNSGGVKQERLRHNYMGTGIWWTTPLLLWLFFDARRIVGERDRLALLAAGILMFTALMFYHSTGWAQKGYNRYTLDYVPILFCLIAPSCLHGRRKPWSAAMIAWSVFYFCVLISPQSE